MNPTTPTGTPPSLSPGLFLQSWHIDPFSPMIILVVVLGGLGFVVWLYMQLRSEQGTVSGGGLNYVVGPMGSGKSMLGVKLITKTLREGRYVVTNVRLLDGWADKLCKWHFPRDHRNPERRAKRVALLEQHYVFERALRTAMRYRVPCATCAGDPKTCGHIGPEQEGRAVFVWDETHNDLNNRDYQGYGADADSRNEEKERRRLVIRWATQLRKLGFSGYLLSQHHENTDAQLRRVCNHLIRLQNQRHRGIGLLLPKKLTLFLVYWYPAHLADGTTKVQAIRKERYFLPKVRHLYDSWETFHGIDELLDEDAPLLLPKRAPEAKPKPEAHPAGAGPRPAGVAPGVAASRRPGNAVVSGSPRVSGARARSVSSRAPESNQRRFSP